MDFTPNEISKLLCLITKIDIKNDIVFAEFPQNILEEGRVYDKVQGSYMYVLLPDHEPVVELIADFQLGIGISISNSRNNHRDRNIHIPG